MFVAGFATNISSLGNPYLATALNGAVLVELLSVSRVLPLMFFKIFHLQRGLLLLSISLISLNFIPLCFLAISLLSCHFRVPHYKPPLVLGPFSDQFVNSCFTGHCLGHSAQQPSLTRQDYCLSHATTLVAFQFPKILCLSS